MNTFDGNPFNLTKANDYSDKQILNYWVDVPGENGFAGMIKPTSPMPIILLGGKGSGKTHLMRYCSYEIQKLRWPAKPTLDSIKTDRYLGVYMRCEGLNADRFNEKGQQSEIWSAIFEYYMELYLAELLLSHVDDFFNTSDAWQKSQTKLCRAILALFDTPQTANINTLKQVIGLLVSLRKKIDIQVNNCAISRRLNIPITVTRSRLIFGIPRLLSELTPLQDLQFLYLIDELENFNEQQQKYIFTLVRERRGPSSFRIGSRLYGIRTYSTFSANEELKEGSEYEKLLLDERLRDEPKRYSEFAKRLLASRIKGVSLSPSSEDLVASAVKSLPQMFEERNDENFWEAETTPVVSKFGEGEFPYFKKLRQNLIHAARAGRLRDVHSEQQIDRIIQKLKVDKYSLLEKVNVLLLYQDWSQNKELLDAASTISNLCRQFAERRPKSGRYFETYDHFAQDLLAQFFRESNQPQRYCGIDSIIHMSMGLPRHLLIVLKHIYNWAIFNGEEPFKSRPISITSQQKGIFEAAEWFYRDAKNKGQDGSVLQESINRLAELFREVRFSDKPVECSLCSFSVDLSKVNTTTKKYIDLAKKYSLLIDISGGQRDRNSMRVDAKLQLNSLLAPLWDLPIYRRGALPLDPSLADAIFDPGQSENFKRLLNARIVAMNAPFENKRK